MSAYPSVALRDTYSASAEATLFNIFMDDPNPEQAIDRAKRKAQDGVGGTALP